MESKEIENILQEYSEKLENKKDTFLGYPENMSFDYNKLYDYNFLSLCINNLGDPNSDSTYQIDSKFFEKEVVAYFAKKYYLEDSYGYVTNCGTEGILYGLYLARENYPNGIVYYSKDSHYAVLKATKLLRQESIEINSLENGEIDYADLNNKINKNLPVILNLNIGTVMKAGIDSVDKVLEILKEKNIVDYYIHLDAALSGMFLEYLPDAPQIDFRKNIHSVSVSGHKFIGSPVPCGIVLARNNLIDRTNNDKQIEYLNILDTTIMGSRSGLAPIIFWYAIKKRGDENFKKEIESCLEVAEYLYNKLLEINYPAWKNDYANTVYFKKPSEEIVNKWQLAKYEDIAHIVAMQHVDKEKIDIFVLDLMKK